jgi:hypothetical protein
LDIEAKVIKLPRLPEFGQRMRSKGFGGGARGASPGMFGFS